MSQIKSTKLSTAIIIVNHNSANLTIACIRSVKLFHPDLDLTFLVYDNSAIDETSIIAAACPFAKTVHLKENKGFANAINTAVNLAKEQGYQYALLLNPDTYCEKEFIEKLLEIIANNQNIAAVTPKILKTDGTLWYAGGGISKLKGGPYHKQQNTISGTIKNDWQPQDFVSCCCLLINIDKFLKVGGLPEIYFLYFEDAELCIKYKEQGFEMAYCPTALIFHHVSATTKFASPLFVRLFARNRIWFMKRNFSKATFLCFMLFNLTIRVPAATFYFVFIQRSPQSLFSFWKGLNEGICTPCK